MECFVIIVNGWKPLTIITKPSVLDVAAALDPPPDLGLLQQIIKLVSTNGIKSNNIVPPQMNLPVHYNDIQEGYLDSNRSKCFQTSWLLAV